MSSSHEFHHEAAAMRSLAARATTSEDREEFERMATAYEALAKTSTTAALVSSGWLEAVAA